MKQNGPAQEQVGAFQIVVLALSLVVIGALLADSLFHLPPQVVNVLQTVDTSICCVLLADFGVRFYRAESKLSFLKWGWIDLIASIPNLPFLRYGRMIRILRLVRLLRAIRASQKLSAYLLKDRTQGGVACVFLGFFLLVTFSSIGILILEGQEPNANITSAEDALWWSVTTVTTVGYGDRFPVTSEGRVLAMVLMVSGVGMFGLLSGMVASVFLGQKEEKTDDFNTLEDRLTRLEAKIDELNKKSAE